MRGISGFVYRTIRDTTRVVGGGLEFLLGQIAALVAHEPSSARRLRRLVFRGTPHAGAPLERGGNWVNPVPLSKGVAAFALAGPVARREGELIARGVTHLGLLGSQRVYRVLGRWLA